MSNLLSIVDLSKQYGETVILRNVNICIDSPGLVAIVGPSGSGKTTLLNMIGMLDNPDTGTVRIQNDDLHRLTEQQQDSLRNEKLGFGFQQAFLLRYLNVLDNVCLPLEIAGVAKKIAAERAMELLSSLSMAAYATYMPHQLSAGQRQRVSVSRAMINQPQILLLDEPTGNLDGTNSDKLIGLIQKLALASDMLVIISTHDAKLMQRADRVFMINQMSIEEVHTLEGN